MELSRNENAASQFDGAAKPLAASRVLGTHYDAPRRNSKPRRSASWHNVARRSASWRKFPLRKWGLLLTGGSLSSYDAERRTTM